MRALAFSMAAMVLFSGVAAGMLQTVGNEEAPTDEAAYFPNQVLSNEYTRMEVEDEFGTRLLEGGTHNVNIRHDSDITPDDAVLRTHDNFVDVWVVQRGSGTVMTGGEMVDGEHVGGTERVIGVGDVVFIPAGVPHGMKSTKSMTWLNIRYNHEEEGESSEN